LTQVSDTARSIRRIEIEKLFGRYNYCVPKKDTEQELSPLMLLYGSNGAGKTTILRIVYHLLSVEDDRGHLTYLARVPFRRARVTLGDGAWVEADRRTESLKAYLDELLPSSQELILQSRLPLRALGSRMTLGDAHALSAVRLGEDGAVAPYTGSFLVRAGRDNLPIGAWLVATQPSENGPAVPSAHAPMIREFRSFLSHLDLALFMLSDDRTLHTPKSVFPDPRWLYQERRKKKASQSEDVRDVALVSSFAYFAAWLSRKRYEIERLSEMNSHSLYRQLAMHLLQGDQQADTPESLANDLLQLALRNDQMERFGIVSRADVTDTVLLLRNSPEAKREILSQVLTPYVRGFRARIEAQSELFRLLTRFVERVNAYLVDKHIEVNARTGISVLSDDGTMIEASYLSSGEKHLLTLLCNAMATRDIASLFIIDEPELSLNITWQRSLVDTLLECVEGSRGQFLMASHSTELFAQHRRTVVRLESVDDD
jgi:ABC-type Mn2+/Zn2+ transport system ATPase subunit